MKKEMKFWAWYAIAIVVVSGILVRLPQGWAQDTSCLNQLVPCLNYLNGTRDPPDSCCDPLKSVIKSNPECLCSMISNNGTNQAVQAGINVTEAQQLPGRCGQHVNPISCLTSSPNSKNSVPNSAGILSSLSQNLIVTASLSIVVQILWATNRILT